MTIPYRSWLYSFTSTADFPKLFNPTGHPVTSPFETNHYSTTSMTIDYIYLDPPLGRKSAGPQSGKIFRRIPKKNAGDLKKHPDPRFRRTEMIKGWIIHKETAFAPRVVFLEHTHSTAQHWSLPVPIPLAHLPNGLRAEPSRNISNLCPSKDFQEETKESFSAAVSLKFSYKVVCSPWFLCFLMFL